MPTTLRCLALAAVLAMLPSCRSVMDALAGDEKPSARIVGLRLADLSLDGISVLADVEVKNPYSVAIPLLGLDFALASGGTAFLRGESETSGTIEARGSRVLPVRATVGFSGLIEALSGVRPGAVVPYALEVGVSVDAPVLGRLRLPVKKSGELPVPTLPDIELRRIRLETLGLDEVEAVLRIRIGNGNEFPLDLAKLATSLSLGGTPIVGARTRRPTTIAAGEKGVVEIPVRFSPLRAGAAVFGLLSGDEAAFGLKGSLDVETPFGPLSMPFAVDGTVPLVR
jgi:LEA14-like dessication related protein